MLHSILAVLGGFVVMAIVVMVTTAIAAQALIPGGMKATMVPGTTIPRAYLAANLSCSALAAILGGAVTARIADQSPLAHGVALAGLMVVMSVVSLRQAGDRQPRWYQVTLMTAMPALALLGSWIGGRWGLTP